MSGLEEILEELVCYLRLLTGLNLKKWLVLRKYVSWRTKFNAINAQKRDSIKK